LAQLAEAYIHFRPYKASDREIRALGEFAQRIAVDTAAEIYGGDVVVHVELEEGSLKSRLRVAGEVALAIYSGVAAYSGFKESVVALCTDAQDFSVNVCAPFSEKAGVPVKDIYRFERRLKTPGKLYRITKRLDKLERSLSELSPKDVQKELSRLRRELNAIADDLSKDELKAVEKALRRPKLPPPRKWPEPEPSKVVLRREDDRELPFPTEGSLHGLLEPPRRIVFQSTTKVPRQRRLRLRRQTADVPSFLDD
jgi:hypothetical protein